MKTTVAACIPSIPERFDLLSLRAIPSILNQTEPIDQLCINVDNEGKGAWESRNATMSMAKTDWIAFLDDDDEWLPHHIETLLAAAQENDADVVWGWFDVINGNDPFPQHRGRQFDINDPHCFTITCMVKRELIISSGAEFKYDENKTGAWEVQDFPFWKSLHDGGAKFHAIEETTWNWHHHHGNTSGLPSRR
jgi:glycosyltransferase involved in cell wall biosynthesis